MGTRRRARRCLATATAILFMGLAGCASAADIAADHRPGQQTPRAGGGQSTPTAPRSSSPTPTSGSTGSPQAPGGQELPNVVGAVRVFLTPSRNIGCRISADQVRCDIGQHVYREPVKPTGCRGDFGQSLAVSGADAASFVCVTDTVIAAGAPVLRYGTSTIVGDFGCTSRITGIRCLSLISHHGFHLSQSSPTLF